MPSPCFYYKRSVLLNDSLSTDSSPSLVYSTFHIRQQAFFHFKKSDLLVVYHQVWLVFVTEQCQKPIVTLQKALRFIPASLYNTSVITANTVSVFSYLWIKRHKNHSMEKCTNEFHTEILTHKLTSPCRAVHTCTPAVGELYVCAPAGEAKLMQLCVDQLIFYLTITAIDS